MIPVDPFMLAICLVQITLVSLAALTGCILFRRHAACRHGMLVAAMLIIAVTPLFARMMRYSDIPVMRLPAIRIERFTLPRPDSAREHIDIQPVSVATNGVKTSMNRPANLIAIGESIWIGIAVMLLARRAFAWHRAWRTAQDAAPCAHLSDSPVYVSDQIAGPISFGLFHPIVLLPAKLVDRLPRAQLDEVLTHEFAHARRGDHIVAVGQQILGALLWPHPLIHLLNRQLNWAREELCDNEVLARHHRADYAATLLSIAQWMSNDHPQSLLALGLIGRRGGLSKRIQNLLDERRIVMTHVNRKSLVASTVALLGIAIIGASVGISRADSSPKPAAATTQPANDALAWHDISVQLGQQEFRNGDQVKITSVRCTADQLQMGELIEVKGTYDLDSSDQADLCLFFTATDGNGKTPIYPQETMTAKHGHGEFTLREPITCHGWPHVSFYDKQSGNNIGGVYFGYGEWLHSTETKVTDTIKK